MSEARLDSCVFVATASTILSFGDVLRVLIAIVQLGNSLQL